MKSLNITTKIRVCDYIELNKMEKILVEVAKEATTRAYSPYSHFQVGAALLLTNQEVISGNNQENIAYPSGLCAERTALFYANSKFPTEAVDTIAVAAFCNDDYTTEPVIPCGACRQVIWETQNRYNRPIQIILYGKKEIYIIDSISGLLPLAFNR
ncbi:MAG: cytidine deaminase [Dysgonamonadaceae bacterium]|jgi:cytidine deaminase|nr:cytidine deaminase [Dysgonamonadaceae bacterium]